MKRLMKPSSLKALNSRKLKKKIQNDPNLPHWLLFKESKKIRRELSKLKNER